MRKIFSEFKMHRQEFSGDRNEKMLKILQTKDCRGIYLFFMYGKEGDQAPGFIFPPLLTFEEGSKMNDEFLELFGKYAKVAIDRQKAGEKK